MASARPRWLTSHLDLVLDFHGGAFMLGSSKMVNKDQIQDCIDRGWIVLAPNHRLCPQVNILEGPIQDGRDLLEWVHAGKLQESISSHAEAPYLVNLDYVFAFGTSSGGTLALCLVSDAKKEMGHLRRGDMASLIRER